MTTGDMELLRIHHSSNRTKAIQTLLGILAGITADRNLNETEILFLSIWIKENNYLRNDPDAVDIMECVAEIHSDRYASRETTEDLKELIHQVLDYRLHDSQNSSHIDQLNILLGLIQGIMADQQLLDSEIQALHKWLSNTRLEDWPATILRDRLENILEDGIISERERADLFDLLTRCGANNFMITGAAEITTMCLGTSCPAHIEISERRFCFTGNFFTGTRDHIHSVTIELGGKPVNTVTKSLDYLVLGSQPSRDWITSSYGRKIEAAMRLNEQGTNIVLLTEETWAKALNL